MLRRLLFILLVTAIAFRQQPQKLPRHFKSTSLQAQLNHNSDIYKDFVVKVFKKVIKPFCISAAFLSLAPIQQIRADDELAQFAAQGNEVGVDGQCFMKKCALETSRCANTPSCLKGLACLARCKGGSLCSTGCFAKFGSDNLDNLLYCSVEKNDCVHVPGKENIGWIRDRPEDLPSVPLKNFDPSSLQGTWYKVMGLDSRYDCFDCQKNEFDVKNDDTVGMQAVFRIPRQSFPGYLQSKITEDLHVASPATQAVTAQLQSQGRMFGLTFWENWYILADSDSITPAPEIDFSIQKALASTHRSPGNKIESMKLVFYTGHTLQGNYKGAFVYSRSSQMTPQLIESASKLILKAGLKPADFCVIRNQCFLTGNGVSSNDNDEAKANSISWIFGDKFFRATKSVAAELADWFEDPTLLSEWLIKQQQRSILQQPLEVSPFASLDES